MYREDVTAIRHPKLQNPLQTTFSFPILTVHLLPVLQIENEKKYVKKYYIVFIKNTFFVFTDFNQSLCLNSGTKVLQIK